MMFLLAVDPVIAQTMIRIFILFVLIGFVLILMNRRYDKNEKARSEMLALKYKVMTKELLDAADDAELTDAVIANLNGKLDKKLPDPYHTIPLLSRERNLVYSLWLVDHELNAGNFQTMQSVGSFRFLNTAAEACDQLEAPGCAEALRAANQNAADDDALNDAHIAYMEARATENPLEKTVLFIRDNAAAFLDEPAPSSDDEHA